MFLPAFKLHLDYTMSYCLSLANMAIYVGRYSWDGIKRNGREPIAWWGGAYDVKIYERPSFMGKVELLKPYVCVYSKTGIGQSISANPEKFAQHICHDFALNIERVVWVEDLLSGENRYEIVQFSRITKIGKTILYKSEKRLAKEPEKRQLEDELQCLSSF